MHQQQHRSHQHGFTVTSRAEAIPSAAGPPQPSTGGAGFGNGAFDGSTDSLHFLGSELGNLSINDSRRNLGPGASYIS
jgi:hypothetical protein